MKRLGMVLLGLMFWSMNSFAQETCSTPPRVLTPGQNSVLLFDEPFVVQWQDDDKCLGDTVKIEIIELSTNERNAIGTQSESAPNTGNFPIQFHMLSQNFKRYNTGKHRIQISNVNDDSNNIKSKKFFIKKNRLENAYSEQELYYDKMEDIAIRDILRRLTTVERENKKLRKAQKRNRKVLEDNQFVEASACQGIVNFDSGECDEEYICRIRQQNEIEWIYGESVGNIIQDDYVDSWRWRDAYMEDSWCK